MPDKNRCAWAQGSALYREYHDNEWGVPVYDDAKLFELLVLESFQAGLSWYTILRKREYFREAFEGFDYQKIAQYTPEKVEELLQNEKIIRNRAKINATINNAKAFMKVQEEFGSFSDYLWGQIDYKPQQNHFQSLTEIPARTPISDKISENLKKRGFKFVGSTTIYALMQSIGMTNDHLVSCFCYKK